MAVHGPLLQAAQARLGLDELVRDDEAGRVPVRLALRVQVLQEWSWCSRATALLHRMTVLEPLLDRRRDGPHAA